MSMEQNEGPMDIHLFKESELLIYATASTGQRFLNYLIDYILMNYVLNLVTQEALFWFLNQMDPEWVYKLLEGYGIWSLFLSAYLMSIINFMIYYTLCEKLFKGQTLGKLITRTKAVREDGSPLTWRDALLRSLCRLIPFEPFSAFGERPWHDSLSKTKVVKKN